MHHIARSSLIVAFFFGLDKIFAFIRQTLVARQFQLSYELDVFNAANNIPDLLSALISGGALSIALIPVLSEYLDKKGRRETWLLFSKILNLAFITTGAIAALLAVFAPQLVEHVIAPGFPAEQKALTVSLMRLDFIAIIVFSLSGLVMAGLQANQHFILPALAPSLYNLGQIFGVLILSPREGFVLGPIQLPAFNLGIYGLVYGVIIGAVLHLLIQIPGLFRFQFVWRPIIDIKSEGVKKVFKLIGPRILTMFFFQLFFIVRDNFASGMGEGAVTALNLGWFIMQVPETLLGTAFAIVFLPSISELFVQNKMDEFADTINKAFRIILALTIPIAILIAIGIRPLVQFLFDFDHQGTEMIVLATRLYLAGLTTHALLEIASRSFYAKQNATIPLIAAGINAALYLFFARVLSNLFGFGGIAAANSIAFTLEAIFLIYLLWRHHKTILAVSSTLIRVVLASFTAGLIFYFVLRYIPVNQFVLSLGGMLLLFICIIPFILPEIRALLTLGQKRYDSKS